MKYKENREFIWYWAIAVSLLLFLILGAVFESQ